MAPGSSKMPTMSRTTTSTGQVPVSKFASCFQAILKGTEKPAPYDIEDPERFYYDLFCLGVHKPYLLGLASEVPDNLLVDSGAIKVSKRTCHGRHVETETITPTQNNIRELFFYAVKCIKSSDIDDPRLPNVIEVSRNSLAYAHTAGKLTRLLYLDPSYESTVIPRSRAPEL
jgi:hypothetical protein